MSLSADHASATPTFPPMPVGARRIITRSSKSTSSPPTSESRDPSTSPCSPTRRLALEGLVAVLKEREARGELHRVSADDLSRHTDASRDFLAAEAKAIAGWSGSGYSSGQFDRRSQGGLRTRGHLRPRWRTDQALGQDRAAPCSFPGVMGPAEYGMLGQSTPMAIGAKLADPSRDVVCITGDGAAGFHFLEMQTAVHEK